MWKWEQQEPFGATPANEDPDADTVAFEFNLRFPGQYFDKETALAYNFYRDFDAATGRYAQSDPIGLAAGLNTFVYGQLNPLRFFDMFGLEVFRSGNSYSDVPFLGPSCRKAVVAGGGIIRWIPCGDPPGPPATSGSGVATCYPGSPPVDAQPPAPPSAPPAPPFAGRAGSSPPGTGTPPPDDKFAKCMVRKGAVMVATHVVLSKCGLLRNPYAFAICAALHGADKYSSPGLVYKATEDCKKEVGLE